MTAARCRRLSCTCGGVSGCCSNPCHGAASPGKGDSVAYPGVAHGLPPSPTRGGVAGSRSDPDRMAAPRQATRPGHGAAIDIPLGNWEKLACETMP